MKILIAGAGIGGLTTALFALQRGYGVRLFEQAPMIAEVGAGLQLSPNAMRVFQKLGLDNQIIEKGFRPDRLETRMGRSGRLLFALDAQGWDSPYVHIHRADLIEILNLALPESVLQLDATVTNYSQDDEVVSIKLSNGDTRSGNYLIGADGIHSAVRAGMLGQDAPQFTGNVAWRATVPTSRLGVLAPTANATVWMGHKRHCVTYRLRGGALTNFVGIVERDDWKHESWTEPGSLDELKDDFHGMCPVIRGLIDHIDPADLFRWALYDRAPLSRWIDGRTVLLGDAAHAMLPFMAQGAAMAIEDGWSLIDCLARDRLSDYERGRRERTSRMQRQSRANMKTFHRAGGLGNLSYLAMWLGGRLAPGIIRRRFNWIYGHDVTQQVHDDPVTDPVP